MARWWKACGALALCVALGGPSVAADDRPSAEQARQLLETYVRENSGGRIRVADFRKTDGVRRIESGLMGSGRTLHDLEFQGQVEMLETGYWDPGVLLFIGKQFSFATDAEAPWIAHPRDGLEQSRASMLARATKGERVPISGKVTFCEKESGWVFEHLAVTAIPPAWQAKASSQTTAGASAPASGRVPGSTGAARPTPQQQTLGSWMASLEAWLTRLSGRLGIETDGAHASPESVTLTQFPLLSQKDLDNYEDDSLRDALDGGRPVGNLACLATVHTMIERGREGGDERVMIDRFYPDPRDPRWRGGRTGGAHAYPYAPREKEESADAGTITVALEAGRPTILHGYKGSDEHYVLVVGRRRDGAGAQQFIALDPLPDTGDKPGREITIDVATLEHPGKRLKGMKFTQMRNVTAGARGWDGSQVQVADRDPARRILEEAIAAHGGASTLAPFRAMRFVGVGTQWHEQGAMQQTIEVFYQYPDKQREIGQAEQGGRRATYDTAMVGETVTMLINGRVTKAPEQYRQRVKRAVEMGGLSSLMAFIHDAHELETVDPVQIEGRWVDGVRPVGTHLPNARLYFDRQTHLLKKVSYETVDEDGRPVLREIISNDYGDWNGWKYVSALTVLENQAVTAKFRISQFQLLEQLDPAVFEITESRQADVGNALGRALIGELSRALQRRD